MIIEVRRDGGFLGRSVTRSLDSAGGDARAEQVRAVLDRVDLGMMPEGLPPGPDMYTYRFTIGEQPPIDVPEPALTDDLRQLADLVLGDVP